MKFWEKNKFLCITFIAGIFYLLCHIYLWLNDFNCLSTDEYLRLYFASAWIKYPKLFIPGEFLPFYFYFYGAAIFITKNIIWAGRILTLIFSIAFLIFFYKISRKISDDIGKDSERTNFSLILLLASPIFIRVTTIPLSEIGTLAVLSAAVYYMYCWYDAQILEQPSHIKEYIYLILSQALFFIANGLRYESWIASFLAFLFIIRVGYIKKYSYEKLLIFMPAAVLPFIVPVFWLVIEQGYFSNPTKFIPKAGIETASHGIINLFTYPKILLTGYPLLFVLLIVSVFSWRSFFKNAKTGFLTLLSAVFFIFLLFIGMKYKDAHFVLPERTLLFFVFAAAPVLSKVIFDLIGRKTNISKALKLFLYGFLSATCVWSLIDFANLPSVSFQDEKSAGISLRKMAQNDSSMGNVLMEKIGTDWPVIYVESNLFSRVYFDRKSIIGKKMSELPSDLTTMSREELLQTVKDAGVTHFVLTTPSLIEFVKRNISVTEEKIIGKISILKIRQSI